LSHLVFVGAVNLAADLLDLFFPARTGPACFTCGGGAGPRAATLAARTGITLAPTIETLLAPADTLVVAFKPQHLASADPKLAELTNGKLVISVLAGKRLARLAQVFPRARNLIWAMPNTPGQIGAGITGWCSLHPLTAADRATVEKLLQALGQHVEVPESQMDALTALSGCGPAYLFEFAAALRDAGVAAGAKRRNPTRRRTPPRTSQHRA
jgi:pyrroline-5-carboxylate reductase